MDEGVVVGVEVDLPLVGLPVGVVVGPVGVVTGELAPGRFVGTTVGTVLGCKAVFHVAVVGQGVLAIAGAAVP